MDFEIGKGRKKLDGLSYGNSYNLIMAVLT